MWTSKETKRDVKDFIDLKLDKNENE